MKQKILIISLLIIVASALVWVFASLPLEPSGMAIDWKLFYSTTHGFKIDYPENRLFTPPWVLALLWPLTVWPLPLSRGSAAVATIVVLLFSVPRTPHRWKLMSSAGLLLFSYPAVRHLVDGNLEAMIVGGVLLAVFALRKQSVPLMCLAVILLSAKVQESWLFLLALAFYLWRDWPKKLIGQTLVAFSACVAPFIIWKGEEWLQVFLQFPFSSSARPIIDSSLLFVLSGFGVADWLVYVIWGLVFLVTILLIFRSRSKLDRSRAALLVTGGLVLSPYVAGNSLVVPLALGIIPLYQERPWRGLLLFSLYSLPYLVITQIGLRHAWENVYWAAVLLVTWLVLVWDLKIKATVPLKEAV